MPDFMGSLLVFSIVLTIFLFSWNSVENNQQKFSLDEQIRQDAYYTASFLVSTPGYPGDWNNSTVEIPGFASESDNLISTEKLREFRNVSYENQTKLLGARNFHLTFRNDTHVLELDSEKLEYGERPEEDSSLVVPLTRNVLIEKSDGLTDAKMRYVVWR